MGRRYDCDIARPAETAREAVQWTYLAYLGAIKEANGAPCPSAASQPSSMLH